VKLSLQIRSFLGLAGLLIALLFAINLALGWVLPPYLRQRIENDLERETLLARAALAAVPPDQLNAISHRLHEETGLRVTIITSDGRVIAESDKKPEELANIENHLNRPEVQDALRTGVGHARRHSDTIGVDLAYCAVTAPQGFVRLALPLHEIAATTSHVRRTVAIASLVVGLLAIPVSYWLTRRVARPISAMRKVATEVARGDFSHRAPVHLSGELGELAGALNEMSSQLESRLRELSEEKGGLAAILAGMTEGVLVTDAAGKIRLINGAVREQLQLTDDAIGKTPLEALRNIELEQLIAAPSARELTFLTPAERIFAVNAAALRNKTGTVVVFHDITRLKQLENVRKEFVANVSHELRTPLSIIKGYIETLLDERPPDPATARQFLETIERHSQRLELLVEDLLNISALESQRAQLDFAPVALRDVASAIVEELTPQAREKKMTVVMEIPDALPPARADRERLRQVFVNLLDNALKYTPAGGRVTITAQPSGAEIQCCISDNGPGIAAEHLPRIFERFYRVDKARSREVGGTGLGLSIVKHIVQAHGGRVWAESETGRGSHFHFTLPSA
jgi:two-component system phosphate regulon sensor histidine kinase PhoR